MNALDFFSTFPAPAANNSSSFVEEDDDWGDFVVNSPDLPSRSDSLPITSSKLPDPANGSDLSTNQNLKGSSELTRASSMLGPSELVNPRGPVPLSVFGVEEEAEGSDATYSSLDSTFKSFYDRSNDKKASASTTAGINDLIANLYRQSGNCEKENSTKPDLMNGSSNSDLSGNSSNSGITGAHVTGFVMNGQDVRKSLYDTVVSTENLTRSPLTFDMKTIDLEESIVDSNTSEANLDSNGLKSRLKEQDLSKNLSGSAVKTDHLNWNPLSVVTKESDLQKNVVSLSNGQNNLGVNRLNLGFVDQNSRTSGLDTISNRLSSVDQNNDVDEEDGWEFMSAESKSQTAKEILENDAKQTENGTAVAFSVSNFSWNVSSLGSNGIDSKVNDGKIGATRSTFDLQDEEDGSWDENEWRFEGAETEAPKTNVTTTLQIEGKNSNNAQASQHAVGFENNVHQSGDFNATSCQDSSLRLSGFDFSQSSPVNNLIIYSNSQSKESERENDLSFFPTNDDNSSNSWAFNESFSESGRAQREEPWMLNTSPAEVKTITSNAIQKKEEEVEKLKGPLPLSIFGDGEPVDISPTVDGDVSTRLPFSSTAQPKIAGPNVSISDLISSLYTDAENKTAVDPTEKLDESTSGSTRIAVDTKLVNEDDEFDDDTWEFKGPVPAVTDSNIAKGDAATDDDDFKGLFSGNGAEGLNSVPDFGNGEKPMSEAELNSYIDFYTKLKNELCYMAHDHMENLKKARGHASDSDGGSEVNTADEEIQELHDQLNNDIIIHGGVGVENIQPKSICINEIIQALQERTLRVLDSEYQLTKRLFLAEKDWKPTIELLKHAVVTLNILTLGSLEKQSNYVVSWSRVASVCAEELRHGASIWRQASEKNVCNEILSDSRGREYFLALGEIYRVSRILGASTRLYMPWILLSPAPNLLALLNECTTLWSISGLVEALQHISSYPLEIHEDGYVAAMLDSIKRLDGLDPYALYSLVFPEQESLCRVSGLVAGVLPDMKMVDWNGAQSFLKLANLWANLISQDPPSLLQVHLNQ